MKGVLSSIFFFPLVHLILSLNCRGKFCQKFFDQSMASAPPVSVGRAGRAIVIMGVSGAGKTTIGRLLAGAINCPFLDADDFHSESNKEKMREGIPLSEEDRLPWLGSLRNTLSDYISSGKTVIFACSALRKQYREILRSADPSYKPGMQTIMVKFVLLQVSEEMLADRVKTRSEKGQHFMPAELLKSQLDLLELDGSEGVICVDGTQSCPCIVSAIMDLISQGDL